MNHISLKIGLDVMQSHTLRRMCFGQYQAPPAVLYGTGRWELLSHAKNACRQVAGLIQKVGGSSSKASSLHAHVLRSKIVAIVIITYCRCANVCSEINWNIICMLSYTQVKYQIPHLTISSPKVTVHD